VGADFEELRKAGVELRECLCTGTAEAACVVQGRGERICLSRGDDIAEEGLGDKEPELVQVSICEVWALLEA
jgi:hypothetical protein